MSKKIGILYCSGEDNAVKTAAKAKDYLSQSGYAYEEVTVTNSSEVQSAATSLAAKCDALYIPIDSTVQAAMEQVVEAATAKKDSRIRQRPRNGSKRRACKRQCKQHTARRKKLPIWLIKS